jgi:hypothetical protein
MKQPNTLPELLRHAADLAEKGESLAGKFEFKALGDWFKTKGDELPDFQDGNTWRIADQDQHLLDDGWIRHTGDVCPVHEMTEVGWIMKKQNLLDSQNRKKIAKYLRWEKEGDRTDITHYKIIKEYVEPTTFQFNVGNGEVLTLNLPYMSAPKNGAEYWGIGIQGYTHPFLWSDESFDEILLKNYNCWRTEADAKAYIKAKLARDKFEIGEIK